MLDTEGIFIFSQENPLCTCHSGGNRWTRDEQGNMQNNGIAKMGSSHKTCGTCEFWEGNRQLDTVNHGRIVNIIEKSGKCNCKQGTKNKSICQYNNTCTKWCKWNNMS